MPRIGKHVILAAASMIVASAAQPGASRAQEGFIGDIGKILGEIGGGADRSTSADERSRKRTAVEMCGRRAENLVQRSGGRGAEIERVRDLELRDGRAMVVADMIGRYEGRDTEGRIACEVDLRGRNEILSFDAGSLVRPR